MKNFLVHTDEIRQEMLDFIGINTVDDLFKSIPEQVLSKKELDLDEPINEIDVQKKLKKLAAQNVTTYANFLGGGSYNKFVPACISEITGRFEFLTAYTPYQPEISQGTLQSIYEFQSMICNLTGMDVSNASVYDGATACAEAVFMACRLTHRDKALISNAINEQTKQVLGTYCHANGIELAYIDTKDCLTDLNKLESIVKNDEYACLLIQTPNYFGEIEDTQTMGSLLAKYKTMFVASVDISSLAVLSTPASYDADIVVGDVQTLGIPMSFGGPYAGFIACKEAYKRQLAGRIVGMTLDKDGKQAFTLTLQTREQHIRREKATSNICSNQALVALASTIYLTVMGEKGLKQVVLLSVKKAHELAKALEATNKVKILNKNYFNEFVMSLKSVNTGDFLAKMEEKGIFAGIKLNDNDILVCTTEMNSDDEIQQYIDSANEILKNN